MNTNKEFSSFRDPSGFLFYHDNSLVRQVNLAYKNEYDMLMGSGLYKALVDEGLLIPHKETGIPPAEPDMAYKVIHPVTVPFISYPYEWCFSQFKDAALVTIAIQKKAFEFGMSLKDASAYNIQFLNGRPVLIDTLSFEKYREGKPWIPYGQFCRHFLSPLSLMSYRDIRMNGLMKNFIDGIPLDLASTLLPFKTRFKFSLLTHIHLHASSQKAYEDKVISTEKFAVSPLAFRGIIESLESAVKALRWKPAGTEWGAYYAGTNYTDAAFEEKKRIVGDFILKTNPETLWDIGANTGVFSRLSSVKKIRTIAFDIDPAAVEINYRTCGETDEECLLPLLQDLTNPSPGMGWENRERKSFIERGPADTVLALALIHHLAISNNVPFLKIAGFFTKICKHLVIEFIPKEDSQVQRLLTTRDDVFPFYKVECFEADFSRYFTIEEKIPIAQSSRILYRMSIK